MRGVKTTSEWSWHATTSTNHWDGTTTNPAASKGGAINLIKGAQSGEEKKPSSIEQV